MAKEDKKTEEKVEEKLDEGKAPADIVLKPSLYRWRW